MSFNFIFGIIFRILIRNIEYTKLYHTCTFLSLWFLYFFFCLSIIRIIPWAFSPPPPPPFFHKQYYVLDVTRLWCSKLNVATHRFVYTQHFWNYIIFHFRHTIEKADTKPKKKLLHMCIVSIKFIKIFLQSLLK